MRKCYIIGHPLKKPRTINLWSKYFKNNNIKAKIEPKEVKIPQLKKFISILKKDQDFLASAVTMPLKKEIFRYIIPGDKIAKTTKAINFIIKKKNKIYGYNTDILALIKLIKKKYLKNVVIIGLGGVGNAVYNVLKKNQKINLRVISRTRKGKQIYQNFNYINLSKINLIINCTPIGSNLDKKYINKSPIEKKFLKQLKKDSFIFDIIYSPKVTKLLKISRILKLNFTNGIEMNSLQAKLSLKMIHKNI